MDNNFNDVTLSTFKNSLLAKHGLRKFLTGKLATSTRQLIDWIDKYKQVEEDQLQGKGKEKVIPQERRDFRLDRYNSSCLRRDFVGQSRAANTQTVNIVFRESVHRVLEKIKNEPYFKWPNKMAGESTRSNQNFYCQYHQDHGELQEPLELLGPASMRRKVEHHSGGHQGQTHQEPQKDTALRSPVGTINVILAAPV
ncbi:uncharacterized protein LOC126719842 [Quercus robur]|uniref:uncharacterized protein LOC126719842 n=1 Tax=Quercus robur TaxID=38942 RepID=UPI002163DCE8|nr:uncharacterized protein LOC126719842 [Quercus robur]